MFYSKDIWEIYGNCSLIISFWWFSRMQVQKCTIKRFHKLDWLLISIFNQTWFYPSSAKFSNSSRVIRLCNIIFLHLVSKRHLWYLLDICHRSNWFIQIFKVNKMINRKTWFVLWNWGRTKLNKGQVSH